MAPPLNSDELSSVVRFPISTFLSAYLLFTLRSSTSKSPMSPKSPTLLPRLSTSLCSSEIAASTSTPPKSATLPQTLPRYPSATPGYTSSTPPLVPAPPEMGSDVVSQMGYMSIACWIVVYRCVLGLPAIQNGAGAIKNGFIVIKNGAGAWCHIATLLHCPARDGHACPHFACWLAFW